MASRPRVTSRRPQRTTRGGPVVTSRSQQPTTPRRFPGAFQPSWYRPPAQVKPVSGGAGGVPASSVAAPQYSLSNLPVDASYDAAVALLQRQRDEGLASIVGERTRTLGDYGFQEGAGGALTFDANNPFSKAAVMKDTYDKNRKSTGLNMGAGGQLYSGAFQSKQDLINRNQLQSEDALQKNLAAFLARNTGQQKQALTDYEIAAGQAYGDRVGRFQDNPLYDPATGRWKTPDGAPPPPVSAAQTAGAGRARAAAKKPPRRIYKPFQPSWRR